MNLDEFIRKLWRKYTFFNDAFSPSFVSVNYYTFFSYIIVELFQHHRQIIAAGVYIFLNHKGYSHEKVRNSINMY